MAESVIRLADGVRAQQRSPPSKKVFSRSNFIKVPGIPTTVSRRERSQASPARLKVPCRSRARSDLKEHSHHASDLVLNFTSETHPRGRHWSLGRQGEVDSGRRAQAECARSVTEGWLAWGARSHGSVDREPSVLRVYRGWLHV